MRDACTVGTYLVEISRTVGLERGLSIMGVGVGISATANYCRQTDRCATILVGADFSARTFHQVTHPSPSVTIRPLVSAPAQRVRHIRRRIRHYPPANVGSDIFAKTRDDYPL